MRKGFESFLSLFSDGVVLFSRFSVVREYLLITDRSSAGSPSKSSWWKAQTPEGLEVGQGLVAMKETWRIHSVTVGPPGWCLEGPTVTLWILQLHSVMTFIKSMTHTLGVSTVCTCKINHFPKHAPVWTRQG